MTGLGLRVVVSGCSGGGKSTLVDALARRGFAVVDEPGRRIVAEERARGGDALPWRDLEAFARRAAAMARGDLASVADRSGTIFFDRGLIDALAALAHARGRDAADLVAGTPRYHDTVFLAPPWPDLFEADDARRHDFAAARAEYDRLAALYPRLGYTVAPLPRMGIDERADFVMDTLGLSG